MSPRTRQRIRSVRRYNQFRGKVDLHVRSDPGFEDFELVQVIDRREHRELHQAARRATKTSAE